MGSGNGWMKSLQCKSSKSLDDVVVYNHHSYHHHRSINNPKKSKSNKTSSQQHHNHHNDQHHSLLTSSQYSSSTSTSCRNSVQSLKDIILPHTTKHKCSKKPSSPIKRPPVTRKLHQCPVSAPALNKSTTTRSRSFSESTNSSTNSTNMLMIPSLTQLPKGHPSRNVVEIIFHTSWNTTTTTTGHHHHHHNSFNGHIEMVFKIINLNRTLTRFEEYRESVKSRSIITSTDIDQDDHARCVADGNEVMRFYCLGPTSGAYEAAGCGTWPLHGKGGVCTLYSGSGCAHDNAGGGKGRRGMLVCRVIAGRVNKQVPDNDARVNNDRHYDDHYDSMISGHNGEQLLVFDSRALLPCFLIIYNKL